MEKKKSTIIISTFITKLENPKSNPNPNPNLNTNKLT